MAAIAAGSNHTCALTTAGAVRCWGYNLYGQLGDGSTANRSTPAAASDLGVGVATIALGNNHTCALTTAGAVHCWGNNNSRQLGDGSTVNRSTPVAVTDLGFGVAAIAAGSSHSCALTTAGAVHCWGTNFYAQLGDGTTTPRTTPVAVKGVGGSGTLSGVAAIAAGNNHSCALTTAGAVHCWGSNGNGQLGDGSATQRTAPVAVTGLGSGVAAIAAGSNHSCALTTGGAVRCWGNNSVGQLGDGSFAQRTTPVAVTGLGSGVAAIAAGNSHTCALTTGGEVRCWGLNGAGQLGDGSTANRTTHVAVKGMGGSGTLSGVAAIAAGSSHTCALTTAGAVHCWGYNSSGQLGDGSNMSRTTPVDVQGLGGSGTLSGVAAIAAGQLHTCARTMAGAVHCWGLNGAGQLGDGSTTNSTTPVAVTGLGSGVAAIAAGSNHTCALTTAGAVRCWGNNTYGQAPAALLAGQALAFAPGSAGAPLHTLALGQSAPLDTGTTGTTYGSWTGDACTVSGSTLTATGPAGSLCGVWAAHAGSAPATAAAPRQLRLLQITQAQPTLLLAGAASNSTLGQSVTFTATLTGGVSPTGTVTFLDGATPLGTATLSGNTATFTTSALAVGPHSLSAQYAGDANNAVATWAALTHTVAPAQPALALAGSASNSTLGQSVTFTATLTGAVNPTGTVTFRDGATPLGTATLSGNTATFTNSALAVGLHSLSAQYAGDANNAAATSAALAHQVNPVLVNGQCGSAHNAASTPLRASAPAASLCSAGTASSVTGGTSTWTWSCTGANSGTDATCQAPRGYTVSTSAGANGTMGAAQTVAYNATATITVTPATGYVVDTVAGCGGSLAGNTFTTGAVTADCTVSVTFKAAPVNGQCGGAHGGAALLASAPAASLCSAGTATSVTGGTSAWTWGCTGANTGTDATCQAPRGYTVSTSAGANGTMGAAQTVAYNATATITVTPATGYVVDTVAGCGGSLAGNTFTTGAVTADCTVSATFKAAPVLTVPEGPQTGRPITLTPPPANGWQVTQARTQTIASVGAALPPGVTLPHGVVALRLELGTAGSEAQVVLTYPEALPAGAVYYKYGPVVKNGPARWYPFQGAQISGNTVTLTLKDGAVGDDDLTDNSVISDPGGVAVLSTPDPAGAKAIPTLGEWALALLAGALGLLSLGALRRRGV